MVRVILDPNPFDMDRLSTLQQFLEEDPADAFTRFALAQELRRLGQLEEAIEQFEELITSDPAYVGTYYHLGALLEETGRKEEAIKIYQTGIRIASEARDQHARAELQSALLEAQGIGFDDD